MTATLRTEMKVEGLYEDGAYGLERGAGEWKKLAQDHVHW
jgi:hypothetical protein